MSVAHPVEKERKEKELVKWFSRVGASAEFVQPALGRLSYLALPRKIVFGLPAAVEGNKKVRT